MNNNQRGSATLNIIMLLLLVVIGGLIYIAARDVSVRPARTIGTSAHAHLHDTGTAADANEFNDGLGQATTTMEYPLDDMGAGLARVDVFRRDINNDGRMDTITRRRIETGDAGVTYDYTIELDTPDGPVDITPDGFFSMENDTCALQKLRFAFAPAFQVIKISRPMQDTWTTPTVATKELFSIVKDQIHMIDSRGMESVCDVSELF